MSSLSHSMKVRLSMAALPMGTVSVQPARVSTKPPTCWDRWRGKPDQLPGQEDPRRIIGLRGSSPASTMRLSGMASRSKLPQTPLASAR
jgi:hypothetical protein